MRRLAFEEGLGFDKVLAPAVKKAPERTDHIQGGAHEEISKRGEIRAGPRDCGLSKYGIISLGSPLTVLGLVTMLQR